MSDVVTVAYARLAPLALVMVTLALAGCGGGSKQGAAASSAPAATTRSNAQAPASASGKALSRAQIIAKTDAVCRAVNAKLNSAVISTRAQLLTVAPQVVSFERSAVSELNSLTPPASLAHDWRQVVASIQTLATTMEKVLEAVKTTSGSRLTDTVRALTTHNYNARRPMLAAAAHGGFSDCARVA